MAKKISGSVGKGGKNKAPDVTIIQELLNAHSKAGGYSKLKVDGAVGKKTIGAIDGFQTGVLGFNKGDGRVDPGKNTIKGLNQSPSKAAAAAEATAAANEESSASGRGGRGGGRLTGKTSGVKPEIIAFVQAVADHFGTTININSGLRSNNEQGEVMWKYWESNLKRGDLYVKIRGDRALKQHLNELYDKGDAGSKREFVKLIAKDASSYSRHVKGMAIDIPKNTPSKVRDALKTGLREVVESQCLHYDNQNKTTPNARAIEKLKIGWKK
ncbi:MAG: hypothetical protein AAGK04_00825 [Planctomycetota bacterium]